MVSPKAMIAEPNVLKQRLRMLKHVRQEMQTKVQQAADRPAALTAVVNHLRANGRAEMNELQQNVNNCTLSSTAVPEPLPLLACPWAAAETWQWIVELWTTSV